MPWQSLSLFCLASPHPPCRSLEIQCGAASELPPEAVPHLQNLQDALFIDWDVLCSFPGMLAWCSQLRSLHVLLNGPPLPGGAPRRPRAPPRLVPQLLDHLAALPHLATFRLVNFCLAARSSGVDVLMRPLPAEAQRLLAEAAARLGPRVRVELAMATRRGDTQLDLWTA